MSSKYLVMVAILFGAVALALWFTLLRATPVHTASGIIAKKSFKPAGTYWQYPSDATRGGFRMATPIPIAEAYIFEISADGFNTPVFFSLNTIASNAFRVGQKVEITYRVRTVPFLWKRLYVIDMSSR